MNCDKPTYFPPNTCLQVHVLAGVKQLDGPPLAKGVFVAILADSATSNSTKQLAAQWFRTSLTPFAGSPLPNGYVAPAATPTPHATVAPSPTPPPLGGSIYPAGYPSWTSTDVFLQALPANPRIAAWSATALNEYNTNHGGMGSWTTFTPLQPGNANDGSTPIYIAQNSDPTYTIRCTLYNCPGLEGSVIHVPTPYVVGRNGAGDGHFAVVAPDKSAVYEFYQAKQPSGGTINISSGTKFLTSGSAWSVSYSGAANAAQGSFVAGVVTADDLLKGHVDHALMIAVPCESGKVYPTLADPDGPCANGKGAPMGGRLWLNLTDAQIDALAMPNTKTTIAKALAHYGAFIMDSAGAQAFSIHREGAGGPTSAVSAWNSVKSTLLGGSDTWLSDGWPSAVVNSFQFLDPCVSQRTC
jgi:hypothetical protein